MPILPPEPAVYPDSLLHGPDIPIENGEDRLWWVLHTRSRAEKSLARQLWGKAPFFLPLRKQTGSGTPRRAAAVPLFPGYVFLFADPDERMTAIKTNLIVNTLPVKDQPRLHKELHGVYRLMESRIPLYAEEHLKPGDRVKVIRGPFQGLEGHLIGRSGGRADFYIDVHLMNGGVRVEIDAWMLAPINETASLPH